MRGTLIAGLLSMALLSACAGPSGSTGTVKGHVYGNGCPGGGIYCPIPANRFPISFQPKDGRAAVTVDTNDNGNYSVQLLAGDYMVRLTRYVVRGDQELHLTPRLTLVEDYEIKLISG